MASILKHVFAKFKPFVCKYGKGYNHVPQACTNLKSFCDLKLILRMLAIMPLLDSLHLRIKFVQGRDVYIYDIVFAKGTYYLSMLMRGKHTHNLSLLC